MTLPAFIFGLIISTIYGALFHLWRGGGLSRLILYLLLGWAGFWFGHYLATFMNWTFLSVGPLHLGVASIVSFFFLVIGYWLSKLESTRK
jgi:hypothetical protein